MFLIDDDIWTPPDTHEKVLREYERSGSGLGGRKLMPQTRPNKIALWWALVGLVLYHVPVSVVKGIRATPPGSSPDCGNRSPATALIDPATSESVDQTAWTTGLSGEEATHAHSRTPAARSVLPSPGAGRAVTCVEDADHLGDMP